MSDYELTPLQFTKLQKKTIIHESYIRFEEGLLREILFFAPQNMTIEKPGTLSHDNRSEFYWHCSSFDEQSHTKYNTQLYTPCINTDFQTVCVDCTIKTPSFITLNQEKRVFCPYRSAFVHAIREIIDMCNEITRPDSSIPEKSSIRNNIRAWYKDNDKHKGEILVSILYSKKRCRYFILLRSCNKMSYLRFITAYPIFEKNLYSDYLGKYNDAKRKGNSLLGP